MLTNLNSIQAENILANWSMQGLFALDFSVPYYTVDRGQLRVPETSAKGLNYLGIDGWDIADLGSTTARHLSLNGSRISPSNILTPELLWARNSLDALEAIDLREVVGVDCAGNWKLANRLKNPLIAERLAQLITDERLSEFATRLHSLVSVAGGNSKDRRSLRDHALFLGDQESLLDHGFAPWQVALVAGCFLKNDTDLDSAE